jgi:hypothetical protein
MKKNKTPSFILELPLKVSNKDEKELLPRFESARQLYNAVLGEAKKRCMLVKQSKLFQQARKLDKEDKLRKELFQKSKDAYDFNDYSLQKFIGILRHNLKNNLDIHTAQKLSTRAFHAVEKILYAKSKKVRFKSYGQLKSVESKSNDAGIRWREQKIKWNGLSLNVIINYKDEVIKYGLEHK